MSEKKQSRLRRATRSRKKIHELRETRLCIHRTPQHIYAQLIAAEGNQVLASSSSLDKDIRSEKGEKSAIATIVGASIAKKAKKAGVTRVAFDRSGFKYHGRVKALAEAARENGLEF